MRSLIQTLVTILTLAYEEMEALPLSEVEFQTPDFRQGYLLKTILIFSKPFDDVLRVGR